MIYVIGGEGFVGSAYVRMFQRLGLPVTAITRANYDQLRGTACDVLINANGNSKKFMSARDPMWDFDASTRSVASSLHDFKAERYVFLSSGDVYPDTQEPSTSREDQVIDLSRISRYGLHKLLAEQLVRGEHRRWLVMRMGGFVGPGLRKNAIFDILTGAPVWLSPQSSLQFIATDAAAALVWGLVQAGVENEIVNLGADGLLDLGWFHKEVGSASGFKADAPTIRYELSLEKLRGLAGGALPSSRDCVMRFADAVRAGEISLS